MAKMSITFKGFEDLIEQIDRAEKDVDKAVTTALRVTKTHVQQNVKNAAKPYASKGRKGYATGAMYNAIIENGEIKKAGSVYEIDVGFDLKAKGGWHSIFVMYGTPRIAKDAKLYNAIKGAKTKREIAELQEKVLRKYLSLDGGGA